MPVPVNRVFQKDQEPSGVYPGLMNTGTSVKEKGEKIGPWNKILRGSLEPSAHLVINVLSTFLFQIPCQDICVANSLE